MRIRTQTYQTHIYMYTYTADAATHTPYKEAILENDTGRKTHSTALNKQ